MKRDNTNLKGISTLAWVVFYMLVFALGIKGIQGKDLTFVHSPLWIGVLLVCGGTIALVLQVAVWAKERKAKKLKESEVEW